MRSLLAPAVLSWACISCSSEASSAVDAGAADGGLAPSCADEARCVRGTVTTSGFTVPFAAAKVQLFTVYPYGAATPAAEAPVQKDGTYALGGLDPSARYYLQAVARFTGAAGTFAIASVVGPVTAPNAATDIRVRPVFLEAFEQRAGAGAPLSLGWASAHVYDPASGKELVDAAVTLRYDASSAPLPYTTNLAGARSYFVQLPAATPAPQSLAFDVAHAAFPAGTRFTLAPLAPDFDPVVSAPAEGATVAAGAALDVAWNAEPRAAYALVELFAKNADGSFAARYASSAPSGPSTTRETIPGGALAAPGGYLLDVQLARPTCPSTADGCVYNASTAAVNLSAK